LVLAHKKQENPTEAVTPDETFTNALSAVHALQQSVDVYNTAVDACNTRINEQKTSVQQGGDITALRKELDELKERRSVLSRMS